MIIMFNNKPLGYTCCFCNSSIESTQIDPCNINVLGQYDKTTKDKPSQDFYCHFECFKEKLHQEITGYFLIDIFQADDVQHRPIAINDRFIDPKEILLDLKSIEHDAFNINRRVELLQQQIKYIFAQIKNCQDDVIAMNYLELLERIQGTLAMITFGKGISLSDRLSRFVYDFDNFDDAKIYYFPKIRSGEYTF